MAYTPHTWTTGETVDAAKLNANEQGTQAAAAAADTANAGLSGKVNSSTYTAGLAAKADLPAGGTDGQALVKAGSTTAWATVAGGGAVSDASASAKGVVQLAGDLGGTAASPTVPGLAGKLTASSNLSDVANAATARTNLGLGTAATSAATAFDASGAATAAQAAAVQRANHTGTQSADTLTDGTTNKAFLATERTKLTGIATGATANSTDAQLRDRSTHTGTQAATTITGLATVATSGAYADLSGKPGSSDPLALIYSQVSGITNRPVAPAPARSSNLWALANFYSGATLGDNTTALNSTTLTPSVTMNGSNTRLTTRIVLPSGANVVHRYRVTLTAALSAPMTNGGCEVRIGARGSNGATHGTDVIAANLGPSSLSMTGWTSTFEIDRGDDADVAWLDVSLYAPYNETAGQVLSLSNVSVYQIEAITPLIRCGWDRAPAAGATFFVDQPVGTNFDGSIVYLERSFGPDGDNSIVVPNGARVFPAYGLQTPQRMDSANFSEYQPLRSLYVGNDEQIVSVQKTDSSYELRGNTHGGEVGASGTYTTDNQTFADYGDGVWRPITDALWSHYCYRVKIVSHRKMIRSDQVSPFLLVDATYVCYSDGTVREDRTNTWQQAQAIDRHIYMMASLNPAANSNARFRARIGRGQQVLGDVDFAEVLAPPKQSAVTSAATGGTLPASPANDSWSVYVTSLSPYGESIPSSFQPNVGTSGTTSTVTVTWTPPTAVGSGATPTGYKVYFGIRGMERLVGTVAAGTTSYTVTALPSGDAPRPPLVNTAWTGALNGSVIADGPAADYSAVYDPWTNVALSLAVDRTNLATLTGVNGIRATVQNFGGVMKNYWHMSYAGTSGGLPYTVPNGTVQASTLWWFAHMPRSREEWHRELQVPTSQLATLGAVYPAT